MALARHTGDPSRVGGYDLGVLNVEDIDRFRKMTPAQRLMVGLDLPDLAWRFLLRHPAEEIQKRLDLAREPWNPPAAPGPKR